MTHQVRLMNIDDADAFLAAIDEMVETKSALTIPEYKMLVINAAERLAEYRRQLALEYTVSLTEDNGAECRADSPIVILSTALRDAKEAYVEALARAK